MQLAFIVGLPGLAVQRRIVESSDPVDLARRVNLALAELDTINPSVFLASVTLSGAGDGDKWVVELVAAPTGNLRTLGGTTPLPGGVVNLLDPGLLTAVCWKAADVLEFDQQRARALDGFVIGSITLEDVTGAAQGLQQMAMILFTAAIL